MDTFTTSSIKFQPRQLQPEWLRCLSASPRLLSLWHAPVLMLRIAVLPGLQEDGAR